MQVCFGKTSNSTVANSANNSHERVEVLQLPEMSRNTDKLVDNISPLFWRSLAQNHGLDPLGKTIEQVNRPLHRRIVVDDALVCICLVIIKVDSA